MNNAPLVSIITPNYNGEKFLRETINSVIEQNYKNWELLICDDKSTDRSIEIIKSYKDIRITLLNLEENQGAAVARNTAIEHSKGTYIAFLDNDDYWTIDKLEKQIDFMIQNDYLFTYTNYIQFSETKKKSINCKSLVKGNDLIKNNYILTSTVIYNADKLGKIYMSNIRKRQDWSLFINILEKSKFAYNLGEDLAYYRKHKTSISSNKFDLIKYNFAFYNNILGYNKPVSFLLMVRFVFYYFLKKIKENLF